MFSFLFPLVFASTTLQVSTSSLVYNSFGDISPIIERVAMCESSQRQFNSKGEPLKSPTGDFGYLQINAKTWDKKAQELGLDYKNSLEDNILMAKVVYDEQSLSAWTCAKKLDLISTP